MEIDVFKAAQGGIQVPPEALRHIGDTRALRGAMGSVGHIAAEDRDAALLNDPNAGDQPQQCRLADAVRTDQADHATGRDRNAHVVERDRRPVVMGDVLDFGYGSLRGHFGSFTTRSCGQGTEVSVRAKPIPRTPVFTWVWYCSSTFGST